MNPGVSLFVAKPASIGPQHHWYNQFPSTCFYGLNLLFNQSRTKTSTKHCNDDQWRPNLVWNKFFFTSCEANIDNYECVNLFQVFAWND